MLPLLKKKDVTETTHQIVLKTKLIVRESSLAK
jgi:LacI family transcriptional regulator